MKLQQNVEAHQKLDMQYLKRIKLTNWKSVQNQTIELKHLNVIVGANGAGKSNLISLFKMLNEMFAHEPGFRNYVGKSGGADSLLHLGKKNSPTAEMELTFQAENGLTTYFASWAAAAGDSLIFTNERIEFLRDGFSSPVVKELGAGHTESNLIDAVTDDDITCKVALQFLRRCRLFHFHDTSENASVRHSSDLRHDRFLFPNADNLATILLLFQKRYPALFNRVTQTVRQMIPAFHSFLLEPSRLDHNRIDLRWFQRGSDYELGAHQLSDGSIRFMALATLLSQPEEMLPLLIALDEPELGLHPSALEILAGLAKAASNDCQLILATQSPVFLDHFSPEDVLIADMHEGRSKFERLDEGQLSGWLEQYSLGEVWEKNVVGGGPY